MRNQPWSEYMVERLNALWELHAPSTAKVRDALNAEFGTTYSWNAISCQLYRQRLKQSGLPNDDA